jgi:hypothetical protein
MANIRPDRLTTCQSERKSDLSRRPSVLHVALQFSLIEYELESTSNAISLNTFKISTDLTEKISF